MTEHFEAPPGAPDLLPDEAELHLGAEASLLNLWRSRGYRLMRLPTYEACDLYGRLYGQEVRQRLVTFTTDREYALRPDLTASLCRAVAGRLDGGLPPATPFRVAVSGTAYRHERVRDLRRRCFHQMGLERIGDHPQSLRGADVEILSLARAALLEMGLPGGAVRVGHARLRSSILSRLTQNPQTLARLSALIDALSRLRDRLDPARTGADLTLDPATGRRRRVDPREHPDLPSLLAELRQSVRQELSAEDIQSAERTLKALEDKLSALASELGLDAARREALLRMTWSAASLGELADSLHPLMKDPVGEPEDPVGDPEDPVGEPEDPVEEQSDPVERPRRGTTDPVEEQSDPVRERSGAIGEPTDPADVLIAALGHIEDCAEDLAPLTLRFSLGATRWGGFYTGYLFEIDAPVLGPDVSQIVGGGRYDGVMEAVGAMPMPACGFALGLERCLAALALLKGDSFARRRFVPREPILICFTAQEADAARAIGIAERLGRSGCAVAFHPEVIDPVGEPEDPVEEQSDPVEDNPTQSKSAARLIEALARLPGAPYRHALLSADGLHLIDIPTGSSTVVSEQDLMIMFGGASPRQI